MQNIDLKILIIKTGLRSYGVERAAGFWPGKLSKFIGGALEPTEADKTALANVLGKSVAELFPDKLEVA